MRSMSTDKPFNRPSRPSSLSELQKLNDRSRDHLPAHRRDLPDDRRAGGLAQLSRHLPMTLSPASIRNVMSDLEHLGLIYAPHTSAGRLPTEVGLRMFVDGLLEVGDLTDEERRRIEAQMRIRREKSVEQVLTDAGEMISGLSHCAGVVLADKQVSRVKHVEFVPAGARQGARGAGRRRRQRREPGDRHSGGAAALQPRPRPPTISTRTYAA